LRPQPQDSECSPREFGSRRESRALGNIAYRKKHDSQIAFIAALSWRSAPRARQAGRSIFLKSDDPRELAREHRRLGYRAAYCPNGDPTNLDL